MVHERRLLRGFGVVLCALLMLLAQPAAASYTWNWVSPLLQGDDLNAIACENDLYVAVGDGGTILHSADGQNWSDCSFTGTSAPLRDFCNVKYIVGQFGHRAVVFGGDRFAAGGFQLAVSLDGRTWTQVQGPQWVEDVAYQNGRFVAVGRGGRIWTSDNGISWTEAAIGLRARDLEGDTLNPDGSVVAMGTWGAVVKGVPGTIAQPGCGSRFRDLPASHPACQAVERVAGQQVIGGYEDGSFRPNAPVTRAQMIEAATALLVSSPTGVRPPTQMWGLPLVRRLGGPGRSVSSTICGTRPPAPASHR